MAPIRNGKPGDNTAGVIDTASRTHARPHARQLICIGPFADNEAGQIRTYVSRDTYRQGVLSTSI